jgi:hypothetical protein
MPGDARDLFSKDRAVYGDGLKGRTDLNGLLAALWDEIKNDGRSTFRRRKVLGRPSQLVAKQTHRL